MDNFAKRLSRWLAWVAGGIVLFGCAVPIAIDVFARFFLGYTLVESFEISGFALAASIGLGMGYSVSTKANVRVDFLIARLPLGFRRVLDLLAAFSIATVAVALAWYAFTVLSQSWTIKAKSESTLQIPLVLPQGLWWLGLFWFATVAVLTPVIAVIKGLRGDTAAYADALSSADLAREMAEIGIKPGESSR